MASCNEYGHDCGHCTDCQGSMTGGNLPPQPAAPTERLLKFFCYTHLRADLQPVSKLFSELALRVVYIVPAGPERTVALRKLLEAKDATVRAAAIPE